ncbi:hypothetical protein J6590_080727 [Homalodisca vitripennis]|nr:hypothetical protein J6590_080727 [Homalodisca vitripennis]
MPKRSHCTEAIRKRHAERHASTKVEDCREDQDGDGRERQRGLSPRRSAGIDNTLRMLLRWHGLTLIVSVVNQSYIRERANFVTLRSDQKQEVVSHVTVGNVTSKCRDRKDERRTKPISPVAVILILTVTVSGR